MVSNMQTVEVVAPTGAAAEPHGIARLVDDISLKAEPSLGKHGDDACAVDISDNVEATCAAEVAAAAAVIEAKRAAMIAAIVAARLQQSQAATSKDRKARVDDFLSAEEQRQQERLFDANLEKAKGNVKDYRMQGEFGQKKFIKP